ncbi:uncharacterized protein LOC110177339 [Drosophila serrata]|uniref:uncharacterized protein LOC110177339 n=1 Tax=Drosophila serrata TaxID=7274 RepID=UPI000A1D3A01|nr:uncharacterized protein LOC110177339 [Drosophila serrata]
MKAILLVGILLACIIVLLKLSLSGIKLDIQNTTSSTHDVVFQKDAYTIKQWFKDTWKHRPKDIHLNIITDPEEDYTKDRLKKLLVILKRKPIQDNQISSSTHPLKTHNVKIPTNPTGEEQTTIIDCNYILDEDCGPIDFGPRLSANLLKILAR